MLGDIDLNRKPVKPQIFLAKPNRTIIAKLTEAQHIVFNKRLGSLNELSFSVPYEMDVNHEFVRNRHVDLVRHRYLLKFVLGKYEEWFVIDKPVDSMTDEGDVKQITAFSLGFELNDKMIRAYKENSKNASQALLDALKYTIWNIGSIDAQFDVKFRSFDVSSKTVLDFVYEIAETFNALIFWDTQNRRIHFYNHELIGSNRGLKLSYGKYLKSLDREIQPDEMTTRLKVFGKDNLSIQRVNSTGTDYIENFGYFMYPFVRDSQRKVISHSDYMSDELCHAILDYTKLIEDHKNTFSIYLKDLEEIQKVLVVEQQKITSLQTELQKIEDNIFISDKNGPYPTGVYEAQKVAKEKEIAAQKMVIQNVQNQVNAALSKIGQLKAKLAVENNFTSELIKERNQYIVEKEWVNEQIIDDKDLLEAGLKVFEEFSKPKTVITMDIVNFLEVIEEQRNWDKLNLGDAIVITYEKLGVNVTARIIEIAYNYNDATIKLTIANVTDIESNEEKFIKSLYRNSSSTKVDMNKFKWDKYENDLGDISKVLEEFWNKAKEQIEMAVNETVIIDRTGITIKDEADPLRFLRLTHGAIGLTKSGGNRYETALTPDGIIAERLFGRIITGERVVVGDPDGILEIRGNKGVITDRNGREVMWFGLFDKNPDRFGLKLENDTNQVIVDRDEGFVITRKKNGLWDKIIWLDLQGFIHAKGLKLHGSKSEIILDAEEGLIDLRPVEGYLGQEIRLSIEDGITVTRPNKNKIWLNAQKGIAIDRYDNGIWKSVFYVDLDGNIVANDLTANNMTAKRLKIINADDKVLLDEDSLNFDFSTLESIILDGVIVSTEKVTLLNQWRTLQQTHQTLIAQIDTYTSTVFNDRQKSYPQLTEAKDTLLQAKTALISTFLTLKSAIEPILANLNESTNLTDKNGFYNKFRDYHDAAVTARNKLQDFLEKSSLQLGRNYNNVVIDAENGIVVTRGDHKVKTVMNATEGIYIESNGNKVFGVDTNGVLYADKMRTHSLEIFSRQGDDKILLDADQKILYLKNFDVIVGNLTADNITTDNIYADFGLINNLAVNKLKTVLPNQAGPVDFIDIEGKTLKFSTATAVDTGVQATDSINRPLFYTDSSKKGTTTRDTGIPVTIMEYQNRLDKLVFEPFGEGANSYPKMVWGAGSGVGDNEKLQMYKKQQEFIFEYTGSAYKNSRKRTIKLSDNGAYMIAETAVGNALIQILDDGSIRLQSGQGSFLDIGQNITIQAAGNVKLTGQRIDMN